MAADFEQFRGAQLRLQTSSKVEFLITYRVLLALDHRNQELL